VRGAADGVTRRRRGGSQAPADALTVREMLGEDAMRGARIIAGAGGLDRAVRRLNVMTVPNIVRWTKQDEFLLTTGYPLPREPAEFCQLIRQLAGNGLAGLGVKLDEYLAEVPQAAVRLADQVAFPIIVIPATSPLDDVLSQTFETIVNRQAAALARSQQIHDAFLRVALTGGGLARLSDALAEILPGADVIICDSAGYPLAATTRPGGQAQRLCGATGLVDIGRLSASAHSGDEAGTRWAAGVIRAGDMRHGFVLAVAGPQGLPAVAGLAVEQAALVAALEITRDLAVLAVEQQFASNALHDLVTGTAADLDEALARAARFGWDLRRPLAVLVARRCGNEPSDDPSPQQEALPLRAAELWTQLIRDRDASAAVAGFATELVAVVGAADAAAFARKVHADLTASTGRAYSLGVSQTGPGPADIPRLYEEARVALQVGLRLSGTGAVTSFAGLGLYRLLSNVSEAELRAFVQDTLGPVLELPGPVRADLLKSLAVLAGTRFNVAESARILHYHYNTMRYRVTKLERMLGEFTGDAAAGLRLGVALEILRMYEISGNWLQPLLLERPAIGLLLSGRGRRDRHFQQRGPRGGQRLTDGIPYLAEAIHPECVSTEPVRHGYQVHAGAGDVKGRPRGGWRGRLAHPVRCRRLGHPVRCRRLGHPVRFRPLAHSGWSPHLGQEPPQNQVATIVQHDGHDREVLPGRRPERLRRVQERPVSHHGHYRLTVPGQRDSQRRRKPPAEAAATRVEKPSRRRGLVEGPNVRIAGYRLVHHGGLRWQRAQQRLDRCQRMHAALTVGPGCDGLLP
jgi:purine catabolism regulator